MTPEDKQKYIDEVLADPDAIIFKFKSNQLLFEVVREQANNKNPFDFTELKKRLAQLLNQPVK